jgi:ubiquinone/menaquinone biosynthesis C-methylase UbiE
MDLRNEIMSQFGNPQGFLGRIAGFIMSHRSSNRERINWSVSLLDVQPESNVLEIGFGPGIGIKLLSSKVSEGMVFGIDRSPLMAKVATRRNEKAIKAGRVVLKVASISAFPELGRKIDRVLDINTFQFWENQSGVLTAIRQIMSPGGILEITHQPREMNATKREAVDAGTRISQLLESCGFAGVSVEMRDMKPVPCVCVRGINSL